MQHDLLKRIILEQHEVIRRTEIIPRTTVLSSEINQVLTGIRRAGKSTLLYSLVKQLTAKGTDWNRIIYINFEDEIKDIRRYYDLSAATGGYIYATSSTILLLVDYLTDVYSIKNINSAKELDKLTSDQQLLRLEIEELIHRLDTEELDEKDDEFYRDFLNEI